jgi:hypothetical protein
MPRLGSGVKEEKSKRSKVVKREGNMLKPRR